MSGETVWWLPRTADGVDGHGNPAVSWPAAGEAGSVRIDGASVGGRVGQGNEPDTGGRELVREPVDVYLPGDWPLEPTDRLSVRGRVYELIGEPFLWIHNRTRKVRGLQVTVRRVEG